MSAGPDRFESEFTSARRCLHAVIVLRTTVRNMQSSRVKPLSFIAAVGINRLIVTGNSRVTIKPRAKPLISRKMAKLLERN